MKFAKELERDAVPEWRIKYLNYKAGKKYVKAVARAVNRANATPRSIGQLTPSYYTAQTLRTPRDGHMAPREGARGVSTGQDRVSSGLHSQPVPIAKGTEGEALTNDANTLQYGSFVPTPPLASPLESREGHNQFELPGPAMSSGEPSGSSRPSLRLHSSLSRSALRRSISMATVPELIDETLPRTRTFSQQVGSERLPSGSPSQLRRLFSHHSTVGARDQPREIGLQTFDLVRERENEFYSFMESELAKVDSFYKLKEEQAGQRLVVLRDQLHEMRNRRIQEIADEQGQRSGARSRDDEDHSQDKSNGWVQPIKAKIFPPGPNTKALTNMPRTPLLHGRQHGDASRDYIRRPDDSEVSYRTAKRKLKLALQEFYRGLELLKSYALLNRTGFRKINKKFDKAVSARPPYRFMNEKVNKAWFVTSDAVDGHIKTVEDLYARYFERGNHKLAAGKLRSLSKKSRDESGSSFLNGFLMGTGLVFTIQGLIYGSQLLFHEDKTLRVRTSYLMQIYGGYFLMLLLFSLFCVNCFIWTRSKVNYPFIFEFDQRHHVDWRRLSEFPSFFLLLFGIFIWMNFSRYGADEMYLYYPVILIGITGLIIFLPLPLLAYNSRKWFAYSHWRLLLAGIYPVEFRDFFLGDMYCSLTYSMANIELFFCLYANDWDNPVQCNSNHSRALGFLTTLPPIWRFVQCIRRYRDTRNIFPHLVNCGKYGMTIMAGVTLSLFRINNSQAHLALFVTFSTINSIYCSIWDLFMDFSLLQAHARYFCLRDILALKSRWPYYAIMVIDPILRFAWIFYAIFTHDLQHSTTVSFLVAFAEVFRRGIWALFRVENEHCANVSQYKASRDVPLPYRIEPLFNRASAESSPTIGPQGEQQEQLDRQQREQDPEGIAAGSSTAVAGSMGTVRRRADMTQGHARAFSKILAEAHKQDFEKRRKPGEQTEGEIGQDGQSDDDDDDDEEEDEDEVAMASDVRHAQILRRAE